MCVFQSWLSMNGMQAVFADTSFGSDAGMYIAYAEAVLFIVILYRFGMIRNVLTDGFARPRDYRKMHDALIAGDPKMRSLRAIFQDIYGAYAEYAKKFRVQGGEKK